MKMNKLTPSDSIPPSFNSILDQLEKFVKKVANAVDTSDSNELPPKEELLENINVTKANYASCTSIFMRMLEFCMKLLEPRFVTYSNNITYTKSLTDIRAHNSSLDYIDEKSDAVKKGWTRAQKKMEHELKTKCRNQDVRSSLGKVDGVKELCKYIVAKNNYRSDQDILNNRVEREGRALNIISRLDIETLNSLEKYPIPPLIPYEFKDAKYEERANIIRNGLDRSNSCIANTNLLLNSTFKCYWKELCEIANFRYWEDIISPILKPYIKINDVWTESFTYKSGHKKPMLSELYDVLVSKIYIEADKKVEFISVFTGYYIDNKEPIIKWLWPISRQSEDEKKKKEVSNFTALHYLIYGLRNWDRFQSFVQNKGEIEENQISEVLVGKTIKKSDTQKRDILGDKDLIHHCLRHPNGDKINKASLHIDSKNMNLMIGNEIIALLKPFYDRCDEKQL